MELKTKVDAEAGQAHLVITRNFDLPSHLVFKAYTEAELLEQWMGTKVIELNSKPHGGFRFETSDANGRVVFSAHGTIHDVVNDHKIVRTFEMLNAGFGVQLESYVFEALTEETSQLTVRIVFESVSHRDAMLKLPFAQGINFAHKRLEEIVSTLQ